MVANQLPLHIHNLALRLLTSSHLQNSKITHLELFFLINMVIRHCNCFTESILKDVRGYFFLCCPIPPHTSSLEINLQLRTMHINRLEEVSMQASKQHEIKFIVASQDRGNKS